MQMKVRPASDRNSLRRHVRMPCQVIEESGFTLIARECVDLSLDGMGVRALTPALAGQPLIVSFRAPGSSLYIDVEAVVARVGWVRRLPLLGLTFTNLSTVDRGILAARLRGLPPPSPARPLRMDYAQTVREIALGASTWRNAA
jgi:hypothetical protein